MVEAHTMFLSGLLTRTSIEPAPLLCLFEPAKRPLGFAWCIFL